MERRKNSSVGEREKKQSQYKRGKLQRYFHIRGGLQMALSRCLANAAAYTVGYCLQIDVHRTTVCRYELLLRAVCAAAAHNSHKENAMRLSVDKSNKIRFQLHLMRGDATNAAIWQRSKLRVAEIESFYAVHDIDAEDSWAYVSGLLQHKKITGDMQVVGAKDGPTTHAIMVKQGVSTGMPHWK